MAVHVSKRCLQGFLCSLVLFCWRCCASLHILGVVRRSREGEPLPQVGIPVLVLEREPGPRVEGAAITFWPNAFAVLELLGVAEGLRQSHPMMQR